MYHAINNNNAVAEMHASIKENKILSSKSDTHNKQKELWKTLCNRPNKEWVRCTTCCYVFIPRGGGEKQVHATKKVTV